MARFLGRRRSSVWDQDYDIKQLQKEISTVPKVAIIVISYFLTCCCCGKQLSDCCFQIVGTNKISKRDKNKAVNQLYCSICISCPFHSPCKIKEYSPDKLIIERIRTYYRLLFNNIFLSKTAGWHCEINTMTLKFKERLRKRKKLLLTLDERERRNKNYRTGKVLYPKGAFVIVNTRKFDTVPAFGTVSPHDGQWKMWYFITYLDGSTYHPMDNQITFLLEYVPFRLFRRIKRLYKKWLTHDDQSRDPEIVSFLSLSSILSDASISIVFNYMSYSLSTIDSLRKERKKTVLRMINDFTTKRAEEEEKKLRISLKPSHMYMVKHWQGLQYTKDRILREAFEGSVINEITDNIEIELMEKLLIPSLIQVVLGYL